MGKTNVVFNCIAAVVLSFCAVSFGTAQENYSGTWVLDKRATHDLPPGLQSYTMVVTQTEQQIVVGTKVEGSLAPARGGGGVYDDGEAPRMGGGGGGGMRGGGGGGMRGGGGGGGMIGGGSPNGSIAIRMYIPQVTYTLDGQKTTSQVASLGTITSKAKWSKDKKTLELNMVRETSFQGRTVAFTSDEKWALSEEGELLKVQRAADTPGATDAIKLIFRRLKGEPGSP